MQIHTGDWPQTPDHYFRPKDRSTIPGISVAAEVGIVAVCLRLHHWISSNQGPCQCGWTILVATFTPQSEWPIIVCKQHLQCITATRPTCVSGSSEAGYTHWPQVVSGLPLEDFWLARLPLYIGWMARTCPCRSETILWSKGGTHIRGRLCALGHLCPGSRKAS